MDSSTVLARLPTQNKIEPKAIKLDKIKIERKFNDLFQKRKKWETRWKEIRDYQNPWTGQFDDTGDDSNPARRRDDVMIDGTPLEACQILASGIMSGLTPPSRPWFKLAIADPNLKDDAQIKRWLDEVQDIIYATLSKSNFYNAAHSVYLDLPFGQGIMAILPNAKTGIHCRPYTIGSYALDVGPDGLVNVFARRWKMSALQIVKQFGYDNCPRTIQQAYDDNRYEQSYKVCWLVETNENKDNQSNSRFNMPFTSIYWLEGSEKDEWLYIGGFEEWPVPIARWQVNDLDAYAKGPGWFCEGDAKMLQTLYLDLLDAVNLQVHPPVVASSATANGGINTMPDGITIIDDTSQKVEPLYQLQFDLSSCRELIVDVRDKIKRHYSADLFMMLDQLDKGQMTAREVIERSQEKLQQLGPVTERLQYEFLSPILERVYGILERAGLLPELPQEYAEVSHEIKIEYISPLAQAQRMSGLTTIEQAVAFVGQMAGMYPDVLMKLDENEVIDRYFEALGASASMLRPDDVVQQMIAQKQQQEQQEKMAAMTMQGAAPMAQAVQSMTDAANNGNPAMAELLGMPGAGGEL